MVGPVFLELNSAKEMHIGGVRTQIGKAEGNLRLHNRLILLRIIDEALLDEVAATATPAGPEAELEERDRQRGRRDSPNHADECLLAADFGPDILAEYCGLKIWNNGISGHKRPHAGTG